MRENNTHHSNNTTLIFTEKLSIEEENPGLWNERKSSTKFINRARSRKESTRFPIEHWDTVLKKHSFPWKKYTIHSFWFLNYLLQVFLRIYLSLTKSFHIGLANDNLLDPRRPPSCLLLSQRGQRAPIAQEARIIWVASEILKTISIY